MIQDKIAKEWQDLSNTQKKIADHIISNLGDAAFMTAEKLAEVCDVSLASVVRFANRLGFMRYSELQNEIRIALRDEYSQIDRFHRTGSLRDSNTTMKTVIRSMQADIKSIEETLSSLKEDVLTAAVKHIAEARCVYVIGTHSEYGIACFFSSTLGWIRDNVILVGETHNPSFDYVADAGEKDVFIAMSFPPYPEATVRCFKAARSRGAHCIAVTDSPLSPLAALGHEVLYARDEKLFFVDNSAPTVSLLTVLLVLVSNYDYEGSHRRLTNKQRYWEDIGFYYKDEK